MSLFLPYLLAILLARSLDRSHDRSNEATTFESELLSSREPRETRPI